ncbi:MAG: glycosyltransferase family 4 protein [Candidatus Buchananbacteria bacterium]
MRVVIVTNFFSKNSGGGGLVAYSQALELKKNGFEVFIFTTTFEEKIGWQSIDGIEIYKIKAKKFRKITKSYICLFNPKVNKEFKNFLKTAQPQIIHFHSITAQIPFSAIKVAKSFNHSVKIFFTAHDVMTFHYGKLMEFIDQNNFLIPKKFNYRINFWQQLKRYKKAYNPFRRLKIRHYLKLVDKIFAVSNSLQSALNQNGIENVEVVYNGIDLSDWNLEDKMVEKFRQDYGLADKKIIFFGGRSSALKGGEKIIQAMAEVKKIIPNAALMMAGNKDKYYNNLSELALKLKVEVVLTGWLKGDELKAAYFCSDIIVTPSICLDTFNQMNIEAMAARKPVVGTCFGGTPEIVVDQKNGYIVNPLNVNMMAEKIIDLLNNPDKAKNFGEAGYERVKEKFLLSRQTQEILKYYNNFLQNHD